MGGYRHAIGHGSPPWALPGGGPVAAILPIQGQGQIQSITPSVGYPNEPAGFMPWFAHDWLTWSDGDSWNSIDVPAALTGYFYGGANNSYIASSLVADPTAPHGQPNSVRIKYPSGHPVGNGVCNFDLTSGLDGLSSGGVGATDHTDLEEIYIHFWQRYEGSEWHNGMNFWRHYTLNRHVSGHTCTDTQQLGNSFENHGNPTTQPFGRFDVWYNDVCGSGEEDMVRISDIGSPSWPVMDEWMRYEQHYRVVDPGTPPNHINAQIHAKVWFGEVLVIDQLISPIVLKTIPAFRQVHFNFNPSGGVSPPQDFFWRLGDIYISGKSA